MADSFNTANPLIILLQFSGVTSYFDVYSFSIAFYENKDIPQTHLIAEEPPWDPSIIEYSEQETHMSDHQVQISIPATAASGPAFISTAILYSLAYDATDVMDDDNLATAFLAQIQINIVMIGTIRKPSVELIVLTKQYYP